jgi:DNA-binding MarR family transcriptional regulator
MADTPMGDTRWLDPEQQRDWRAFVDGIARLTDRLDRVLRDGYGLSMAEYEILVRLTEADQRRHRMADLAESVSHSRSRLSHTVGRLERDGLVRRESCGGDGRGVYAVLTDEGYAQLEAAARDHVTSVRDYFVDVIEPADLVAIGRAFRSVIQRLDGPTRQPAG